MPRQAYTASEAARRLGISLDTLRRWDRQGRIKTTRDEANRRVVAAKEVERLLGTARAPRAVCAEPADRRRAQRAHRRAARPGRDGRGTVPDRLGDHERGRGGACARSPATRRPRSSRRPRSWWSDESARGDLRPRRARPAERNRRRRQLHRVRGRVADRGLPEDQREAALQLRRLGPARAADPAGRSRGRVRGSQSQVHAAPVPRRPRPQAGHVRDEQADRDRPEVEPGRASTPSTTSAGAASSS